MKRESEETKPYLLILRFFSGFREIENGLWRPYGPPAIYRLIEALEKKHIGTDVVLSCKDSAHFKGRKTPLYFEFPALLHVRFAILPYIEFTPVARLNMILNDFWHFLYCLIKVIRKSPKLVYCVRATMPIGAFFTLFGRPKVVLRLMGESGGLEFYTDKWNALRHPIAYFSLRAKYHSIVASLDGSRIRQLIDRCVNRSVNTRILLNGTDKNGYGAITPAVKTASPLSVLYVARFENTKGSCEFAEAVKIVAKNSVDFRVTIVGYGEKEQRIKETLTSPDLEGKVTFLGKVPNREMASVYDAHDVFVSLNTLGNLNNTVLEALSRGLCLFILKRDESGVDEDTEKIIPEECAVRVSRQRTKEDLAEKLIWVFNNPELIKKYKESAKEIAKKVLKSWDDRMDEELDILEKAVSR